VSKGLEGAAAPRSDQLAATSKSLGRYGLAPCRQGFRVSDGTPASVQERLESFAAAFLTDPTPGLVFEYGRLVLANDAARKLLGIAAADEFLESLKASLGRGDLEPGLRLQTRYGVYAPKLQPARTRPGHPTVICFLNRQRRADPAFESLTEREREVVMLLVKGLTNGEIASVLGLSVETVRKHVSSALEKTGMKTRAGLVGRALGR
jgi:DNA-binding CsgD family transcriptional regulator